MSKSALYAVNTLSGSTLADGSTYPINQVVRRFGCDIIANGAGVTCRSTGYYDIDTNITVTAGAAGVVEAQLYCNGTPIPGAVASMTVTDGATVTLPVKAIVRVNCCGNPAEITAVVSGMETTSVNAAIIAEKL